MCSSLSSIRYDGDHLQRTTLRTATRIKSTPPSVRPPAHIHNRPPTHTTPHTPHHTTNHTHTHPPEVMRLHHLLVRLPTYTHPPNQPPAHTPYPHPPTHTYPPHIRTRHPTPPHPKHTHLAINRHTKSCSAPIVLRHAHFSRYLCLSLDRVLNPSPPPTHPTPCAIYSCHSFFSWFILPETCLSGRGGAVGFFLSLAWVGGVPWWEERVGGSVVLVLFGV